MYVSLLPLRTLAKVLWVWGTFLVVAMSSVHGQTRHTTRITEEQELVVREEARNLSASEDGAFNLQDRLDAGFQQGIKALVFEVEQYEFESALVLQRSLNITSRLPNSMKTQLSCMEVNQILTVERSSENVTVGLRNVKITNCTAGDRQGVVHVASGGRVIFEDVGLMNNFAEGANHAVVVADSNSALEVRGNSSFSNNQGRVMLVGGGSEVILENSSFRSNIAETNGTVLATKPGSGIRLSVRGSQFEGNVARGSSGGVMWLESSSIVLENGVQFISNVAGHHGGALFLTESRGLRISDTLFESNACQLGKGGAAFIVPSTGSDTRIRRSIFTRNSANGVMGIGGAIAFGNTSNSSIGQLDLGADVLFLKNTARVSGGAVIVYETRTRVNVLSAFINNSAQGAAGGLHVLSSETDFIVNGYIHANVSDASFDSNRARLKGGGGVVLYGSIHMTMSNVVFRSNNALKGGAVFVHDARRVVFREECHFEGNSATKNGGSLYMQRSYVDVSDCNFIENEGERGGGISIKDGETFHVQDCIFERNRASYSGGAIDIENLESSRGQDTRASLKNIVFRNNTSLKPQSREGFGGAMRLAGAGIQATLERCFFESNTAHWGGGLYLAEAYHTTLEDTNFTKNTASLGGALYVVPLERQLHGTYDSTNLRSCFLRENRAARGGAIFARPARLNSWEISEASNSLLSVKDTIFLANRFHDHGYPRLRLSASRANNTGGGLFLALMNASFDGCSFRNNSANDRERELTINSQVTLSSSDGGAVYASDGSSLALSDTNFIANSASGRGGAVCFEDALFDCKRSCTFQTNRGRDGGGIFSSMSFRKYESSEPALLHCNDCVFERNSAQKGGTLFAAGRILVSQRVLLSVGGIYASIPRIERDAQHYQTCEGSNSSDRNSTGASRTREDCKDLVFLDPQKMQDNNATVTGHDIFSTQPDAIMVATENGNMTLVHYFDTMVNEEKSAYMFASPAHTVKSNGSPLRDLNRGNTSQEFGKLEFYMSDSFKQSVKGSRIVAELWQCQNNSDCCSSEKRRENEEDTPSGMIVASRVATNGTMTFEGLEISDNKNRGSEFPLWACFVDEEDEQVSLAPIFLNISFRDCYIMERHDPDNGGCSECDPGRRYAKENNNCANCPEHATCRGLTIIPDDGYWQATSISHRIYKCHPREACIEDKERHREEAVTRAHKEGKILYWTDPNYDQCDTGYEGILCGSCEEDHGRWNDICTECLGIPLMWISLFVSVGWNLLVLLVFIYSARYLVDRARYNQQATSQHRGTRSPSPSRAREIQQIQMIPRITNSPLHSDSRQASLPSSLDVAAVKTGMQKWIPSTRSILRRRSIQETIPSEPLSLTNPLSEALKIILNFMQMIYLAALLSEDLPSIFRWSIIPFDSLNLTETVFLIADCLLKGYADRAMIRMTLQALFPLLLFFLVCLVPVLLLILRKNFDFGLQEVRLVALCTIYLYFTPEVRNLLKFLDAITIEDEEASLETTHFWAVDTSVTFLQGSHSIVVGAIVCPLLIAFTICFPFSLFVSLKKNKDRMQEEDVVSCYGFLYKGYKSKYYYWETVIMIRKTVIAVVSVFVQNAELQSVFISLTLVLFLSLQLTVSPFSSDFPGLNLLESLSLGVSTLVFLGVTLMLRSHELGRDQLLLIIAYCTLFVLFVTLVLMTLGLFAALEDFLNDKLIEKRICPDRRTVQSLTNTSKILKLLGYYSGSFYSFLLQKSDKQNLSPDDSQV